MNSSAKILLVDDDRGLREFLSIALVAKGYEVIERKRGEDALEAVQTERPDAVLLDLGLPDLNGMQVLERLRTWSIVPVIVISVQNEESTVVKALNTGGDDYLIKPFHREELLARIHALLRRHKWGPASPSDRVPIGGGWVDFRTAEACTAQGSAITLAEKELGVLKLLSRAQGASVSRNRILDEVWGRGTETTPRTVDNFILKLRKQFEPLPRNPKSLVTVRGKGYRLRQAEPN